MKTLHLSIIILVMSFAVSIGLAYAQYGPNFYPPVHYPPTNDTKLELLIMNSTEFKEKTAGYNYTLAGIYYNWIPKGYYFYDFGGARVTFLVWGFGNVTTKGESFNVDSQMKIKNVFEYDADNPPPGYPTDRCNADCFWANPLKPVVEPKTIESPLKQFQSGIAAKDVACRVGLDLVIKAEDGSPACVKPDTAQKLLGRGWEILAGTTSSITTNVCGQFYAAPGDIRQSNTVPVLLINSNSTSCARLTYTIISNYKDCNGKTCQNIVALNSTLHIGNLHYERHDSMFSVSSGKDYTNSFNIATIPSIIDLDNYPIGTNFTVTYIIKPLTNATGFYDQSIPKLACERYPLAVGYTADEVNASDFSYIDPLNPPCEASVYTLTGVEISGMDYKQVTLWSDTLGK